MLEKIPCALRPALVVTQTNGEFRCGQATASAVAGRLMVQQWRGPHRSDLGRGVCDVVGC